MWHALATYSAEDGPRPALVIDDQILDIAAVWSAANGGAILPDVLRSVHSAVLSGEAGSLTDLAARAEEMLGQGEINAVPNARERLLAPFLPPRIFGTASNYHEHAAEMNTVLAAKAESSPYIFMKASTSVIGTGAPIVMPPETEKLDWEVELGVVIGRGGRRIRKADALDHIAGYTVVNDVSSRDLNRRSDYPFKHDWFRGKSWDTFCPMGPWFVPRDCIADPHELPLQLTLNGDMMQDGNTSELIWNIFEQVEYVSSILTLMPGDLIMTGTPAGVGMGRGLFLASGDALEARVIGIGSLQNPVVAEQELQQEERA